MRQQSEARALWREQRGRGGENEAGLHTESDVSVMSECSSPSTPAESSRVQQKPPGLTWSFSIRAEFLLAAGTGEVTPGDC